MKILKIADGCFTVAFASFVAFMSVGVGVRVLFGITADTAPQADRILDATAGFFFFITVGAAFGYIIGWVCDFIRR